MSSITTASSPYTAFDMRNPASQAGAFSSFEHRAEAVGLASLFIAFSLTCVTALLGM